MPYNNGPRTITNGLVLALDAGNIKSYLGSGTTWTDLSGNNNTATLVNGPTFNSANGGSIVFDGNDDQVNLPSLGTYSKNSLVSIEAWVYVNTTTSLRTIISQYSNGSFFDFGIVIITNKFCSYVERGNQAADIAYDTETVQLNKWYSVTGIYDGSFVSLYVNGLYKSSVAYSAALSSSPSTAVWYIGKFRQGEVDTDYYWFNGNISSVKVYSRVLSAQEVLQNYNATRSRFGI